MHVLHGISPVKRNLLLAISSQLPSGARGRQPEWAWTRVIFAGNCNRAARMPRNNDATGKFGLERSLYTCTPREQRVNLPPPRAPPFPRLFSNYALPCSYAARGYITTYLGNYPFVGECRRRFFFSRGVIEDERRAATASCCGAAQEIAFPTIRLS